MNHRNIIINIAIGILIAIFSIPAAYYYTIWKQHEYDTFIINDIVGTLQDEIINCNSGNEKIPDINLINAPKEITSSNLNKGATLDVNQISVLIQGAELKHRRSIKTDPEQLMKIIYLNIHSSRLITRDKKTEYLAIVERTLVDAAKVTEEKDKTEIEGPSLTSKVSAIISVIAAVMSLIVLLSRILSVWLTQRSNMHRQGCNQNRD